MWVANAFSNSAIGLEMVNRAPISRVNRAIDQVLLPEFRSDERRAEFAAVSDAVFEGLGGFAVCLRALNSRRELVGEAEMRSEKGEDIDHSRLSDALEDGIVAHHIGGVE